MIKRLKGILGAMLTAILMATIFPVLRIGGGNAAGGSGGAGGGGVGGGEGGEGGNNKDPTSAEKETPEAPPVKTPEERIKELEGEVTAKGAKITELETQVKEVNSLAIIKLAEKDGSLKKAIAGYKNLIVTANPEVLPEMISGDSIEALDNSLAKGKELVAKLQANLAVQTQKKRIPAGAPPRAPEDFSGLSAREKISRGLR